MTSLDQDAVERALQELPGWRRDGQVISKTFVNDHFRSAMLFVGRVAEAAEAVDQYPDIDIRGGWVAVAIGSPGAGGLSEDQLHLAHRIERLVGDHHHQPGLAGP